MSLIRTLQKGSKWEELPPGVSVALLEIAQKMGRIVCGDWTHQDHYDDIAGYAAKAGEVSKRDDPKS